jgi:hypothetical protein
MEMILITAWIPGYWTMESQRRKAAKPSKQEMDDWMVWNGRMWWK